MDVINILTEDRLLFVLVFVLLVGVPLIFMAVPSARRFFAASRAAQAVSGCAVFLLFGLILPQLVAATGMLLAWLFYLGGFRRNEKWAYAFWLPATGTSLLATFLWLWAIGKASSRGDGMGEGFAKFGAFVIVYYFAAAPVILLISLLTWPREPEKVRVQSISCGLAFLIGFIFVTVSEFMKRI